MRVKFNYKNHEGKIEERDVDVAQLGFDFKNHSDYGYQPGWYVGGLDYSRGRDGSLYRNFYLTNIILPDDKPFNFRLMEFTKS